ncbi:hypothetical protein BH10ACT3_BH10ACT3_00360 [soil metagenome]
MCDARTEPKSHPRSPRSAAQRHVRGVAPVGRPNLQYTVGGSVFSPARCGKPVGEELSELLHLLRSDKCGLGRHRRRHSGELTAPGIAYLEGAFKPPEPGRRKDEHSVDRNGLISERRTDGVHLPAEAVDQPAVVRPAHVQTGSVGPTRSSPYTAPIVLRIDDPDSRRHDRDVIDVPSCAGDRSVVQHPTAAGHGAVERLSSQHLTLGPDSKRDRIAI